MFNPINFDMHKGTLFHPPFWHYNGTSNSILDIDVEAWTGRRLT